MDRIHLVRLFHVPAFLDVACAGRSDAGEFCGALLPATRGETMNKYVRWVLTLILCILSLVQGYEIGVLWKLARNAEFDKFVAEEELRICLGDKK